MTSNSGEQLANSGEQLGRVVKTNGTRAICLVDHDRLTGFRSSGVEGTLSMGSIGGLFKIRVAGSLLVGSMTDLSQDVMDRSTILAEIEYIGEGDAGPDNCLAGFRRGVDVFPQPGDAVYFAETADYERIFAPPDAPTITVGTVYPTDTVRAPLLVDQLLGRHFAIVGASGTGKSTSVALLLQRIIDFAPHGHVVILDPHGEYARAFGDAAKVWDVSNLELPYWAMNLEEHCDSFVHDSGSGRIVDSNILAASLQKARSRNVRMDAAAKITPDSPVSYQVADLIAALEEQAGRLEKIADAHRYTQLRLTIEQYFNDERFRFIFNADFASHSLERFLGEIMRVPGHGKPISIIDLAGVPTEIVNVVVATISRLVLDFAIRSTHLRSVPVLLVCEEAHRYLPREHDDATASVERQLERVAREGRKYGVCLGLVSQRPSELSETALSQCGTIMSLRLNNLDDQDRLKASLSEGARAYVDVIAALKNRECVISGEGVPVPMRVVIDTLEAERRPASDDPQFSKAWSETGGEEDLLAAVVRSWRGEV
ncbi:DUF87 domain-containing protein [Novosphingobium sp. ZN18A2]|uniref:ATP-binding protein n=1 Tax=Novosphingobium sp. ZN18A2 TaxID=3079861 RepID=UPI0030D296A9